MTVSELISALSEYDSDMEVQAAIHHRLLFRLYLSLQEVTPVIDMDTNKVLPSLSLLPWCEEGWYNIIKRNKTERREGAGLLPPMDLNLCLDGELTQTLQATLAKMGMDMETAFNILAKKWFVRSVSLWFICVSKTLVLERGFTLLQHRWVIVVTCTKKELLIALLVG